MWILGNLFSKNPTILYTIDDKKEKERRNNNQQAPGNSNNERKVLIEDPEHLKKFFGME